MTGHPVWQVDGSMAEIAGATLSRAFLDDPLFMYALPDQDARARLCPPLFAAYIRYACHVGETWAIGPDRSTMAGVIYWTGVPRGTITPELTAQWGLDAAIAAWGAAHDRLEAAEQPAHETIDTLLPEPRRYVGMLGVDPQWQGQGLGSALVARVLADAADAGVPVSTWTMVPRNVPFYQRAGFRLVAEGATLEGTMPWWCFLTPDASLRSGSRRTSRSRSSATWIAADERRRGDPVDPRP